MTTTNLIHTKTGTSCIKNTLKCKSCGHEFSYVEGTLQNIIKALQIKAYHILKETHDTKLYEALNDINFDWTKLLDALSSCCGNPQYSYVNISMESTPAPKFFVSYDSMGLTGRESEGEINKRVSELWNRGKLNIQIKE